MSRAEVKPRPGLRWYYGPTETDPERSKMWCYDCRGEVLFIEDAAVCSCGLYEEIPDAADGVAGDS